MADPLVDAATSLLAWCDGSGAAPAPMVRALRSALADRSHVSRLEESLRVALEARAEVVEVLKEAIAMLPEPYTPGDGCEHGFVRDSVDEPCPFVECEDRKIAALLDRAGRAIGGAK